MSHDQRSNNIVSRMSSSFAFFSLSAPLAVALLAGLALVPKAAQARGDVRWAISIGVPAVPAAVYVEPAPVYMAPPPPAYYYAPPPRPAVYVQPAPVVYGPPAYGYYDERSYRPRHHHHHHGGGYRDSDRDGVPDRYDRRPGDPWRR